jgi:hypothetical protein
MSNVKNVSPVHVTLGDVRNTFAVGLECEGTGNTVDCSSKYRHCMFEIHVTLWNWSTFQSADWIIVCTGLTVCRPFIIRVIVERSLFGGSGELESF